MPPVQPLIQMTERALLSSWHPCRNSESDHEVERRPMSQEQDLLVERYGRYREVYHCSNDCAHSFRTEMPCSKIFFSRGRDDLSYVGKLLSTIAVQLAATFLPLKNYICEAIAEKDGVEPQKMCDQWKKLIHQPYIKIKWQPRQLRSTYEPMILIFVLDALDECGDQEKIRNLLQLLSESQGLAALQLRVIVTSRLEIPIRLGFGATPGSYPSRLCAS